MKETRFYLDWRPCATTATEVTSCALDYSQPELENLKHHAVSLGFNRAKLDSAVKGVSVAYRSDGFFAFAITFDGEYDSFDHLNYAAMVASHVKESTGHVHTYDKDALLNTRVKGKRSPLQKYPVRVKAPDDFKQDNVAGALKSMIGSNKGLTELKAHRWYPDNVKTAAIPVKMRERPNTQLLALSILRGKYASLFDKTVFWVEDTKTKNWHGFAVFGRFWFFLFVFFTLVVGLTVYSFNVPKNPIIQSVLPIAVWGWLSAISVVLSLMLLVGLVRLVLAFVFKKKVDTAVEAMPQSLLMSLDFSLYPKRLKGFLADIYFYLLITGCFLFPLQEVPDLANVLNKVPYVKELRSLPQVQELAQHADSLSLKIAFSHSDFVTRLFDNFFMFLPIFLCGIYLLDIGKRRRGIIAKLNQLIGHLRYASLLDKLIFNIRKSARRTVIPNYGFEDITEIAQERLQLEHRKRVENLLVFWLGMVLAFYVSYDDYLDGFQALIGRIATSLP